MHHINYHFLKIRYPASVAKLIVKISGLFVNNKTIYEGLSGGFLSFTKSNNWRILQAWIKMTKQKLHFRILIRVYIPGKKNYLLNISHLIINYLINKLFNYQLFNN